MWITRYNGWGRLLFLYKVAKIILFAVQVDSECNIADYLDHYKLQRSVLLQNSLSN